jgi:hypothetical protein
MKIPYKTIEAAFFFVASDQRGMNSALHEWCKDNGVELE